MPVVHPWSPRPGGYAALGGVWGGVTLQKVSPDPSSGARAARPHRYYVVEPQPRDRADRFPQAPRMRSAAAQTWHAPVERFGVQGSLCSEK